MEFLQTAVKGNREREVLMTLAWRSRLGINIIIVAYIRLQHNFSGFISKYMTSSDCPANCECISVLADMLCELRRPILISYILPIPQHTPRLDALSSLLRPSIRVHSTHTNRHFFADTEAVVLIYAHPTRRRCF